MYEQEADRVADQVMRMPGSRVQRTRDGDSSIADTPGKMAIGTLTVAGQPLPDPVRSYFEPRFGHDFRGVRIHADAKAAESARSIGARAYTFGKDIVFARDEYKPHLRSGHQLLAHELTHFFQQSGGSAYTPDRMQINRAVRINNGAQRVNEADYLAGGAKSSVGSRFRVSSLIADSVRRIFVGVAELEQYANSQNDYLITHEIQPGLRAGTATAACAAQRR